MVSPEVDGNDVRVNNVFVYPPPGRIPIAVYELTFNPRTKEISATLPRTLAKHYNATDWVIYDVSDDPNIECIQPCSEIAYGPWEATNSIPVYLTIVNHLFYYGVTYPGYDVRAIFVQIDTDDQNPYVYDYNALEILDTGEGDEEYNYTDIWAPSQNPEIENPTIDDPDIDADGYGATNPFHQYWSEKPRMLSPSTGATRTFTIMINQNQVPDNNQIMRALLMVDVCQEPVPPDWPPVAPNCPEPYQIDVHEGVFRRVLAGQVETFTIRVWDHQCEDYGVEPHTYDNIDIDLYSYHDPQEQPPILFGGAEHAGNGEFNLAIYPIPTLKAGLYECVIKATDNNAPNKPLKKKIWFQVDRVLPAIPIIPVGEYERISSPVRAKIDVNSDLKTIFTAGPMLYAIGTGWGDNGVNIPMQDHGYFPGVPTIVDDVNSDSYKEILIAWDNNGQAGLPRVFLVNGKDGTLLGVQNLPSAPAGTPVMVDADDVYPGDEIFVLCKGGYGNTQALYTYNGFNLVNLWEAEYSYEEIYFGSPAVMSFGGSDNRVFTIWQEPYYGPIWRLEVWKLTGAGPVLQAGDDMWCNPYIPTEDIEYEHSPVICMIDGTYYIITPTFSALYYHTFVPGPPDTLVELFPIPYPNGMFNVAGQVALGDMNHDGYLDVVVPYVMGVSAFCGPRPSPTMQPGALIWSWDDPHFGIHYMSPALIDCNGDSYLDVVTGTALDFGLVDPDYRLVVLDGSPFNNHDRTTGASRIIWEWNPGDLALMVNGQCPVLTMTPDNTLRFGMVFKHDILPDPYEPALVTYNEIDTKFGFHHADEGEPYQPKPWLKASYSLSNWNNYEEDSPEYNEGG